MYLIVHVLNEGRLRCVRFEIFLAVSMHHIAITLVLLYAAHSTSHSTARRPLRTLVP